METVSRKSSGRALLAIGAVGLAVLALACAPQPGGVAPSTTTTTTSTTLPWSTPTGQWTNFTMTCYVNVFGTNYTFPQNASVNVEAPATVAAGSTFNITVAPGEFIVPTDVQGNALTAIQGFTIRFPLSPNVQFVDSVMSAGINMGPGYPSLKIEGGFMVYRVPGPFVPGSTVQMPKNRLTFTATGPVGSTIQTKMATLSNQAVFGLGAVDDVCYPDNPNLVFWTTTIV